MEQIDDELLGLAPLFAMIDAPPLPYRQRLRSDSTYGHNAEKTSVFAPATLWRSIGLHRIKACGKRIYRKMSFWRLPASQWSKKVFRSFHTKISTS
jgi:hypothetical protein